MADEAKGSKPASKDGLALVVGGLFILALVFATYNYFNKKPASEGTTTISQENIINSQENPESGSINGNGATNSVPERLSTITTPQAAEWVANDYQQGDISGSTYTVKAGDTLWEIAEAVYGNGAEWTKILEANKASIGFLPNGQQALIFSGQALVMP